MSEGSTKLSLTQGEALLLAIMALHPPKLREMGHTGPYFSAASDEFAHELFLLRTDLVEKQVCVNAKFSMLGECTSFEMQSEIKEHQLPSRHNPTIQRLLAHYANVLRQVSYVNTYLSLMNKTRGDK